MTGHVRGDVRKAQHDHDGAPCWTPTCAPTHHIHHDPAVREIVAREVDAERERIVATAERHANARRTLAGPPVLSVTLAELERIARNGGQR